MILIKVSKTRAKQENCALKCECVYAVVSLSNMFDNGIGEQSEAMRNGEKTFGCCEVRAQSAKGGGDVAAVMSRLRGHRQSCKTALCYRVDHGTEITVS